MSTKPPFIRSPYNYDLKAASEQHSLKDFGESMTIQSMTKDAEINTIIERIGLTGQMPEPLPRLPQYGDYTDVVDFRTALERVTEAREHFMAYPAQLRARFDNDPAKFLDFVQDPKNGDEMIALGLRKAPEKPPELTRDTQAIVEALRAQKAQETSKTNGTT